MVTKYHWSIVEVFNRVQQSGIRLEHIVLPIYLVSLAGQREVDYFSMSYIEDHKSLEGLFIPGNLIESSKVTDNPKYVGLDVKTNSI